MGLTTRLAAGAVGGLVLGVLLAIALGLSDTKLRRRERIEDVTGIPLLGTLVADKQSRDGIIDIDAGGLAVERPARTAHERAVRPQCHRSASPGDRRDQPVRPGRPVLDRHRPGRRVRRGRATRWSWSTVTW